MARIRIRSNGAEDGVAVGVPLDQYQGGFELLESGIVRLSLNYPSGLPAPSIDVVVNGDVILRSVTPNGAQLLSVGENQVGFVIDHELPAKASGQSLILTACLAGTDTEILRTVIEDAGHWISYSDRARLRVDKLDHEELSGWVVDQQDTAAPLEFDVLLDGTVFRRVENGIFRDDLLKREISRTGRGGFQLKFPVKLFAPHGATVSLRFPDGSVLHSQFVAAPDPGISYRNLLDVAPVAAPLKVIVPIFNAFDDVVICVEKLLAYTPDDVGIILIDDASSDPRIREFLGQHANRPNFQLILSDENRGFTRSVNAGIAAAAPCDVILLNSDARVTPGWIAGLRRAAGSDERICTVTPMSDRAGAFSAPRIGNENVLPAGVSEHEFAVAVRRRGKGLYPSVPTGNGFCMYVRRAALDEIGLLDDVAFPRGYGEENDFCMRAERAGWRHVIDDRTYVFHERSKSFGSSKEDLMVAGRAVVDARYPEYGKRVQVFSKDEQINQARFNVALAEADLRQPERTLPRILYVISTQSGGTPQTNRDLMKGVSGSWEPWLLHCNSKVISLYKVGPEEDQLVLRHQLSEFIDPISYRSREYEKVVAGWLNFYAFDIVHMRHIAWHSIELPAIARASGSAVVMSFHDYHALCPTVKLVDGDGRFCGGTCTTSATECKHVLWPDHQFPVLKDAWVHEWQKKYARAMENCDLFITTSRHARALIASKLSLDPERFLVIPHGRDFAEFGTTIAMPSGDERLKVVIPGHIDSAKGADIIKALVEMDVGGELEFHIMGPQTFPPPDPRIVFHGLYKREDFLEVARKVNAHIGAVLSTWDETWCHTLTELWSAGLPVAVLDYPTLADRVEESGAGWVFPRENVSAIYDALIAIRQDRNAFFSDLGSSRNVFFDKLRAVQAWQRGLGRASTTRLMSARYEIAYKSVLRSQQRLTHGGAGAVSHAATRQADIVAVVCPANADQLRANASTHIRVWERTLNDPQRRFQYLRMTPDELVASVKSRQVTHAILQRNILEPRHWRDLKAHVEQGEFTYIIDMDDDLLNVPADKDESGWYASTRDCLREVLGAAACILASTPALKRQLGEINGNVVLVENALSNRIWRGAVAPTSSGPTRRALYMGTASHLEDLQMIIRVLARVADENPTFRLKVIGVLREGDTALPWVEIVDIPATARNYPEFISWLKTAASDCDFAIAPLAESDFNDRKSPLKVLEYAGLGLPVLASGGEVYTRICGEAPFATAVDNTVSDWLSALESMIATPRHRLRRHGEAMREWVLSDRNLEAEIGRFDEIVASNLYPVSNG